MDERKITELTVQMEECIRQLRKLNAVGRPKDDAQSDKTVTIRLNGQSAQDVMQILDWVEAIIEKSDRLIEKQIYVLNTVKKMTEPKDYVVGPQY